MKEEDFIERKEKILLAALGKSWLWKASRLIIGIIPPVGAFVMLVHCSLLSMGFRVKLTEWIFDCSLFGFIAWIIVSLAYGFCWVHRAFATYGVLISFCIDFQRSFGFGVRVTDTYINADLSRVDGANRRVIDYVLYDKK